MDLLRLRMEAFLKAQRQTQWSAQGRLTPASGPRFTVSLPTASDAATAGETPTSLMTYGEKPSGGWMGAELVGGASGAGNSMTYANVYTDIDAPHY